MLHRIPREITQPYQRETGYWIPSPALFWVRQGATCQYCHEVVEYLYDHHLCAANNYRLDWNCEHNCTNHDSENLAHYFRNWRTDAEEVFGDDDTEYICVPCYSGECPTPPEYV